MSKRKILFTSHTANFQKFNRPLMRMLRGTLEEPYADLNIGGWEVDYASAGEEKIYDADHSYTIDFDRNPLRFDRHRKAYKQLKKIIDEGDYEVIHTHTPVGSILTRMAARGARKKGTKVIYTCHGFHFFTGASLRYWFPWYNLEKSLAKDTDLLITINREDFKRAKKEFYCRVEMIDGVGVDTAKFKMHTKAEQKAAREAFGLAADDYVMVYLAEFTGNKNHRMLIEAAAPLMRENPKIKLLFLGQGPLMDEMKELAQHLGVTEQVLFPGYVRKDYAALVQSCNLCVSASKREGLGLGVLECMYCKLPILIANNRGHRDIVGTKKKPLFELNDVAGLRKKMREAMLMPEDYYVEFPERYALSNSLSEMRAIYEEFLG